MARPFFHPIRRKPRNRTLGPGSVRRSPPGSPVYGPLSASFFRPSAAPASGAGELGGSAGEVLELRQKGDVKINGKTTGKSGLNQVKAGNVHFRQRGADSLEATEEKRESSAAIAHPTLNLRVVGSSPTRVTSFFPPRNPRKTMDFLERQGPDEL